MLIFTPGGRFTLQQPKSTISKMIKNMMPRKSYIIFETSNYEINSNK